jgi:FkbM family methyltransferase
MKSLLRAWAERLFRRLPVSRAAYIRADALQARVDAFKAAPPEAAFAGLSAAAQVGQLAPRSLESLIPVIRTLEDRVLMATRCRDADGVPKVPNAGAIVIEPDGNRVQIMHNGVKVIAGGYYGDWMQGLITRCRGHHEPQEETLFAELMKYLPADAVMFELGGFWSFYTIWFLSQSPARRGFVVEADPAHLEIGRMNARLNAVAPVFLGAYAGAEAQPPAPFQTEASGTIDLPCVSVESLMQSHGLARLDLLHCDAQGAELAVLESLAGLAAAKRLDWVMVSTHSHHITGDPLTHQRCLAVLCQLGATIVAEHDVQESFSGDGLIVARFGALPDGWRTPVLSHNRSSESLFRNPLYDLAQAVKAS